MDKLKTLRTAINQSLAEVSAAAERFPWTDKNAYAMWLAQTYYFVNHTTVLLTLSAAKLGTSNRKAHRETLMHLREETGHDQLAANDIKALGYQLSELPELLDTSVFYQSQYYWLDRFGPFAYYGYVLLLEGLAVKQAGRAAKIVEQTHGRGLISFLKVHAEADTEHFEHGVEGLAGVSDADLQVILRNLDQSCRLYVQILDAIVEYCQAAKGTGIKRAA